MSDDRYRADQASGTRSDLPASESGSKGKSPMSRGCCGTDMGDVTAECPCSSIVRRHPVISSAILAVVGLAFLAVPAGAILGIIAFFRTI